MKLLPTRDLILLGISLTLLVGLFWKSRMPDIEAHHRIQDSLLIMRQHEARLGLEVLKQLKVKIIAQFFLFTN